MSRSVLLRYLTVPVSLAITVGLEKLHQPLLGPEMIFLLLWPAVLACAWFGGQGPGILATGLGALAADYFLVEPRYVLFFDNLRELSWMALFGVVGISLSILSGILHRSRQQQQRQSDELAAAHRSKDDFLAILGHELRGPLSAAVSVTHLLQLKTEEATVRQFGERLQRQLDQMTRLADDLLDVSRISRGELYLCRKPVALAEVVEHAVDTTQWLIHRRGHELTVTRPPEVIQVHGDADRLVQVVANLLTNAAKYTPERGHIRLTVQREGNEALVRVSDDGVGLAPEMLSRVFELYAQAGAREGHSRGGLGIGLALVRRLVELHGGRVSASSAGLGKGSEFVVRLPIPTAVPCSPEKAR